MIRIDSEMLNECFKKVVEEKVEVTLSIEPDRVEIQIQPWKPFTYACPYRIGNEQEETETDG